MVNFDCPLGKWEWFLLASFLGGGGESHSEGRETNGAFNSVRDYIVSRDQIGQFWHVLNLVYIRLNHKVY